MNEIYWLITITERKKSDEALEFFSSKGVSPLFSTPCHGTAQQSVLDLLSIEKSEKVMLTALITEEEKPVLFRSLLIEYQIDVPGNGISMVIPLSSIGGKSSLKTLTDGRIEIPTLEKATESEQKEEKIMFSLIVCFAERGFTELVMNGARAAGAGGGTVIHSRGTSGKKAFSLFGSPLGKEKEMILIVAKEETRQAIMESIEKTAGKNTPAKTAIFSVPVEDVIGLRSLKQNEKV